MTNMKTPIWISKEGEHGLVRLSLFRRFVNTQGGQYAAKISGALFSAGN